jgi:hypothetical protein
MYKVSRFDGQEIGLDRRNNPWDTVSYYQVRLDLTAA